MPLLENPCLSPPSAAVLVYRGDTYARNAPDMPALFHYERRVWTTPTGLVASHLTRDAAGGMVLVETATLSPNYGLERLDVVDAQRGLRGTVVVGPCGRHLEYELVGQENTRRATEDVSAPVLCGPSLFGFILLHWELLCAGACLPLRMVVVRERRSYGFGLKLQGQADGQLAFTVTPTHWLVRLALAPLRVVFDAHTRQVVRYEGRVPPLQPVRGRFRALDARVEYTPVAAVFL